MIHRRSLCLAALGALALPASVRAQRDDAGARDRVRTESGVDPTRIVSRAALSAERVDFPGGRATHALTPLIGIGRGRWAAALEWRWAALEGAGGEPDRQGFGDLSLSATWAARPGGPHGLAVAAKVVLPTGVEGIGGRAVGVTPSATWVYSTDARLVVAVQPQYAFTVAREAGAPALSLLTLRGFVATFRAGGLFGVAELRLLRDLERGRTEAVASPVIGWNAARGITLALLAEFPLATDGRERRGTLMRAGVQKVF